MKTLLGTAAGLMVATGAYAADLPGEAAPAAVDYVKVCDAYGAGFFYIPGTETCLDISGRVRARVAYSNHATLSDASYTVVNGGALIGTYSSAAAATAAAAALNTTTGTTDFSAVNTPAVTGKRINFKTDAQVKFDARTASDLGTVRSFFVLQLDSADGSLSADDAFIQVGYLTVGKIGNAYGDVFYGDTGAIFGEFDQSTTGAQIMVDSLGGGFYAGAGILASDTSGDHKWAPVVWVDGYDAELMYTARLGVRDQSWGSVDLSGFYQTFDGNNDVWGVKATADLKLIDKLSARLVGTYVDYDTFSAAVGSDNYFGAAGALKFQATDALDIYAGLGAKFWDKQDTATIAQLGADYAFTPDLILTAEVNYVNQNDDNWDGMLKLTRNW
ncbi:porin [Pleomorphomonas koreensis]|uniref:porin n=1 Tax=Pleomorphomonas koreensis TaxID=257440 RepID=UPI001469D272|nr:porin [Pleomorphomonas koreensis]